MQDQTLIQELLRTAFNAARARNPRFSMRAFAKRLGVHVGTLSYVFNGRRSISRKLATKILDSLQVESHERERVLAIFPVRDRSAMTPSMGQRSSFEKARESGSALPTVEARAVLELLRCPGSRWTRRSLIAKLDFSPRFVKYAVSECIEAGWATQEPGGEGLSLGKPAPPEHFELSEFNLARARFEQRTAGADFRTLTFAMNAGQIDTLRALIDRFLDESRTLGEHSEPDTVFRMDVVCYPVSSPDPS